MFALPIALLLILMVHEAAWLHATPLPGWALAAVVVLPRLALGGWWWASCRATVRALGRKGQTAALRRNKRAHRVVQLAVPAGFAADLAAGLLLRVREPIGDVVLVDELAAVLPSVALLAWVWWCEEPIDRRFEDARRLRRMDEGRVPYPPAARGASIAQRLRVSGALVWGPMLVLLAASDAATRWLPERFIGAAVAGSVVVMGALAGPVAARVLPTRELGEGDIRAGVLALAARAGVRLRGVRLWRTDGRVHNAAVVGLLPGTRRVLLTDALLDDLPEAEVEAVVAHEIAHLQRGHLRLILGVTLAALGLAWSATRWVPEAWLAGDDPRAGWLLAGVSLAGGLGWVWTLVNVLRLFEREADVRGAALLHDGATVTAASAAPLQAALRRVSSYANRPMDKADFMHDAIATRVALLDRAAGQRLDDLPVTRSVRRVRWAVGAALLAVVLLQVFA